MCVVTDSFAYNDRTLGVVCVRGIGSQEPNAGSKMLCIPCTSWVSRWTFRPSAPRPRETKANDSLEMC